VRYGSGVDCGVLSDTAFNGKVTDRRVRAITDTCLLGSRRYISEVPVLKAPEFQDLISNDILS